MADHLRHFEVTEPPGSTPTLYSVYAVTVAQGIVESIIVHLPSGHGGQTGIQISYGTYQVIPEPPDTYYRGNKRTRRFPLSEVWPTGGDWFVQVYNEGRYSHVFEVDFFGDALDLATAQLPTVILLRRSGEAGAVPVPVPVPGSGGGSPGGGGPAPV